MDILCAKCAKCAIFSTSFCVLLIDYYCWPHDPLRSFRRYATCGGQRVRRSDHKAREGTGFEGSRRSLRVGCSTSGTTSTPSGARRSILVSFFAGRGASGERRGVPAQGQPGRGGRDPETPRGTRGSAVRRAAGADPDDPFRQVGRSWRRPRPQRTGPVGARVTSLSRVRGDGPQGRMPRQCKGLSTRPPARRKAVAREPRMLRPGGASPSEASGSCPARTRMRRISVQRA